MKPTGNETTQPGRSDQHVRVDVRRVAGSSGPAPPPSPGRRRGAGRWPMASLVATLMIGVLTALGTLAIALTAALLRSLWLGACRRAGRAVAAVGRLLRPARPRG